MKNGSLDGDDLLTRLRQILSADDCIFVLVTAVPVRQDVADYSVFRNGCTHETMALLSAGKQCLLDEARDEHRHN